MKDDDEFIRELLRRKDVEERKLTAARKHHDERVAAIDVLLESAGYVNGAHVQRPDSSRSPVTISTGSGKTALVVAASGGPTTREYIRDALKEAGAPLKMADIVTAVAARGSAASGDTVRTVLQKMLHSGQVIRPDRGMYALPSRPLNEPIPDQEVLNLVDKAEEYARTSGTDERS